MNTAWLLGCLIKAKEKLQEIDRESVREFALYRHEIEHLTQAAIDRGDVEGANRLRQRFLLASDRNTANYNRRHDLVLELQYQIAIARAQQH